jgi:hypothetical protein
MKTPSLEDYHNSVVTKIDEDKIVATEIKIDLGQ